MAAGEHQRHVAVGPLPVLAPARGLDRHAAQPLDATALHCRNLCQCRRIPAVRQVRRFGPAQPLATLAQAGRPRGPVDDGEFNHLALVLQRENDRHEPLRRRAAAPHSCSRASVQDVAGCPPGCRKGAHASTSRPGCAGFTFPNTGPGTGGPRLQPISGNRCRRAPCRGTPGTTTPYSRG